MPRSNSKAVTKRSCFWNAAVASLVVAGTLTGYTMGTWHVSLSQSESQSRSRSQDTDADPDPDYLQDFTAHMGAIGAGSVPQPNPVKMTVKQAMQACREKTGCRGFSFRGSQTMEPVDIYFQSNFIVDKVPGWTSYTYDFELTPLEGFISAGDDVPVPNPVMTVEQAKQECRRLQGCKGFTFRRPQTTGPVFISFKAKSTVSGGAVGAEWTSYIPSSSRRGGVAHRPPPTPPPTQPTFARPPPPFSPADHWRTHDYPPVPNQNVAPYETGCNAVRSCNGVCVANVEGGYPFQFRMKVLQHDRYISWTPLCTGRTFEEPEVREMLIAIKDAKSGSFLDIGANLGSWTLPLAVTKRQVISVEASPLIAGLLRESLALNHLSATVRVENFAIVSKQDSARRICVEMADNFIVSSSNAGTNRVNIGNRGGMFCNGASGQEVKTTTLDNLWKKHADWKKVVAAKIDCEGCEGAAIFGAQEFLSTNPPCILALEINENALCQVNTSVVDLSRVLANYGYESLLQNTKIVSDGSCAGFREWLARMKNPPPETFVLLRQKDFRACMSRFAE